MLAGANESRAVQSLGREPERIGSCGQGSAGASTHTLMAEVLACATSTAGQLAPSWQQYAESLRELEQRAPHLERAVQLQLLAAAGATVRALRNALRLGQNGMSGEAATLLPQPSHGPAQNAPTVATLTGYQDFQVDGSLVNKKESELNVHAPKESTQIRVRGLGRYDVYNAVLHTCERLVDEAGLAEEEKTNLSGRKSCVKCLSLRDSTTIVDFKYEHMTFAVCTCSEM